MYVSNSESKKLNRSVSKLSKQVSKNVSK